MSRRTERLGSLIRRVVAEEIVDLGDPRISQHVAITRVDVSADLSIARVFVSVMGSDSTGRLTVHALQHAAGRIQAGLSREVHLRQCPRLVFQLDESIKRGFEIVQIIEKEMAQLGAKSTADAVATRPDTDATEAE